MSMDVKRFEEVRKQIIGAPREQNGIGTLGERTLHAVLKSCYAPETAMQEVRLDGYVTDIFTGTEIIEIQTTHFEKMRSKLDHFLPGYPVTIVYPVPQLKYLIWIDEDSSVYRAFYELYKIKSYLPDKNLHLRFPLLAVEEYRLLNGWSRDKKRGSSRYDRIPTALLGEICLDGIADYRKLIPENLDKFFTAVQFGKAVGERKEIAGKVLHVLNYLKVVERCGREGHAYVYRVCN